MSKVSGTGYEPDLHGRVPEPPSSHLAGRVVATIFEDVHGLSSRDLIGMDH
jgi:hypothetical protein